MRKWFMVLRVAAQSLIVHKMRSFLTMLGVVIGVGAVIALVAVGQGTQAQVISQVRGPGFQPADRDRGDQLRFLARRPAAERAAADQRGRGRDPGPGDVGRAGRPGVQRQQHQRVIFGQDRLAQHQRCDE